ncbi:MAG: phosphate acyltransferase PlsX [Alphaproteobacteria bacterium]
MSGTGHLVIALDAMGGDGAPEIVIRGAEIARQRFPNVHFLIFGDEKAVRPRLDKVRKLAAISTIVHSDEVVTNDMKPSLALRAARRSSMRLAIDAVADGRAKGVVSAGNTGALMAMAKIVLRSLDGIDRPAIAAFLPTKRGETLALDLGANIECDANNLVQFATMGAAFANIALGVERPSVGLLNVGAEELKGNDRVREAAAILKASDLPLVFHGFIEGDQVMSGIVDVVVTDGFTGNIALKTVEGTSRLYTDFLRQAFRASWRGRLSYLLARPVFRQLRARVDPRRYNGAVFLGLNGVAVKSHGGTDAFGFANAVGLAIELAAQGINDRIRESILRLTRKPDTDSGIAATP